MKKKLALAAALIPNPDLLFLDEPFEGVDAVASACCATPSNNAWDAGATVFLTSHVLEIVEKLCTTWASSRWATGHQARWRECGAAGSLEDKISRGRRQRWTRVAKAKLAGRLK